jgi:hypothetical protein
VAWNSAQGIAHKLQAGNALPWCTCEWVAVSMFQQANNNISAFYLLFVLLCFLVGVTIRLSCDVHA